MVWHIAIACLSLKAYLSVMRWAMCGRHSVERWSNFSFFTSLDLAVVRACCLGLPVAEACVAHACSIAGFLSEERPRAGVPLSSPLGNGLAERNNVLKRSSVPLLQSGRAAWLPSTGLIQKGQDVCLGLLPKLAFELGSEVAGR